LLRTDLRGALIAEQGSSFDHSAHYCRNNTGCYEKECFYGPEPPFVSPLLTGFFPQVFIYSHL
jgi:hypothetical protein